MCETIFRRWIMKMLFHSPSKRFSSLSPTLAGDADRTTAETFWERKTFKAVLLVWIAAKRYKFKDFLSSAIREGKISQLYAQKIVFCNFFLVFLCFQFKSFSEKRDGFNFRRRKHQKDQFHIVVSSLVLLTVSWMNAWKKNEIKWKRENERVWMRGQGEVVKASENFLSNNHALSTWPSDTFIYHHFLLDKLFLFLWFIST